MTIRTNRHPNPGAEHATLSLESNTACTVARSNTFDGLMPSAGSYYYTLTATATSEMNARTRDEDRAAASSGQSWLVAARVKNDAATSRSVGIALAFWTAAPGATTGSLIGSTTWVSQTLAAGEAATIYAIATAPATTASVGMLIRRAATGSIGDVVEVDELLLEQTDAFAGLFDGDTSPATRWTGTAGLSTSELYVPVLALTVHDDDDPAPRVVVSLTDPWPEAVTASLHRQAEGQDLIVPQAEGIATSSGFVVTDYFAGLGTLLSYVVEFFDAAGASLGFSTAYTAQIDDVPIGIAYFQSPHDPRVVARVELLASAGSVLMEGFRGDVHQIGERRILIASAGTGLDDLDMSFWTDTVAAYRTALAVLKHAKGAVVIRTPPPMEVPRTLYMWIPRAARMEVNLPVGIEEFDWEAKGTQISPPSSAVIAAVITYRRFAEYYPTYRDFNTAYSTYRQHALNPPPEV